MEFELRNKLVSPVFSDSLSYPLENPVDLHWEPESDNMVKLKSGNISVVAKILSTNGQSYTGIILGFEDYDNPEYKGKRADDVINFNYNNIISCIR